MSTARPFTHSDPGPQPDVRRLSLAGAPGPVVRARDFARESLQDWGWIPPRDEEGRASTEDVLLVVSELVTNACLHGGGPQTMSLTRGTDLVRIEVTDLGDGMPAPRTGRVPGRPGGHGMFIVERLSVDWGILRDGTLPGKTVWAEMAVPKSLD
ncbi:ATP-binding protein [Streptomyces calidiresistens]|uniref:ATP-binding protein n=1 Tax=Streptomyces calidiresistens TaxID=1485586 RepID=A0A7W3XXU8_9ACTN|nr:ATP-binding protein [Streptomyces calidiresistens]MBB0231455.1 ATP-binding protein [Streptomyces calidiresistens]